MTITTTRRILLIGRVPAINQRVVAQLGARGADVVGAAGEGSFPELDARGFDLVAIGAGVDPETRASLKQRFRAQHPDVLLLDVYGPLATEQIYTILRRASGTPALAEDIALGDAGEVVQVHVTVRQSCRLRLDVHRHRGSPEPEVIPVAAVQAIAGVHTFAVARAFTGEGHMLIVRADDDVEVRRLTAG
ncbi:hypothetical protein [Nannocystis sp.]|uniref:hypothetical protein n=1 Tax=Nannocystis sp. TaxID=1962667 RepID=UPI0025FD56D3|nr:hypothetical protein [Nannocystis sp.]MBK7829776.1 hypothetical protein [Nannocystis sp.]